MEATIVMIFISLMVCLFMDMNSHVLEKTTVNICNLMGGMWIYFVSYCVYRFLAPPGWCIEFCVELDRLSKYRVIHLQPNVWTHVYTVTCLMNQYTAEPNNCEQNETGLISNWVSPVKSWATHLPSQGKINGRPSLWHVSGRQLRLRVFTGFTLMESELIEPALTFSTELDRLLLDRIVINK